MIPSIEQIEVVLSNHFDVQKCVCMPQLTMFFEHEIDFLAVRKTGFAIEVEIKRSLSDMRAEQKKAHKHESDKIVEFYYCFPTKILEACTPLVPERAGILEIYWTGYRWRLNVKKNPVRNKDSRKLTDKEIRKILRYSNYRIWSFKKKIVKLQRKLEKYEHSSK
jgi:hypothetical protein